jgi:hypothetical protein
MHLSLEKDTPEGRPIQPPGTGKIGSEVRISVEIECGGLFIWACAQPLNRDRSLSITLKKFRRSRRLKGV